MDLLFEQVKYYFSPHFFVLIFISDSFHRCFAALKCIKLSVCIVDRCEAVVFQIQTFENLIEPVVESIRFLSDLEFDVLSFCIIEHLASPDKQQLKVCSFVPFLLTPYPLPRPLPPSPFLSVAPMR